MCECECCMGGSQASNQVSFEGYRPVSEELVASLGSVVVSATSAWWPGQHMSCTTKCMAVVRNLHAAAKLEGCPAKKAAPVVQ